MCEPEKFAVSVSAVAAVLAQGRAADELDIMSAVFVQLGDTLATIATARGICENMNEQKQEASSN